MVKSQNFLLVLSSPALRQPTISALGDAGDAHLRLQHRSFRLPRVRTGHLPALGTLSRGSDRLLCSGFHGPQSVPETSSAGWIAECNKKRRTIAAAERPPSDFKINKTGTEQASWCDIRRSEPVSAEVTKETTSVGKVTPSSRISQSPLAAIEASRSLFPASSRLSRSLPG